MKPPETADLVLLARIALAMVLVVPAGWDRQRHHHAAGLRTHLLVAASAALFVGASEILVEHYRGNDAVRVDPTRAIHALAVGIGFLGSGTIVVAKGHVRGLTTAASVLATAAVGVAAGLGRYVLAVGTGALVFLVLVALRRFEPDHPDTPGEQDDGAEPTKTKTKGG